jgi:hypothetical protein
MYTYFANARWPMNRGISNEYGEPESSDKHQTEREALAVCKLLEKEGYGGDGEIFPVRTWVSEKCKFEDAGWCSNKDDCPSKLPCDDDTARCEDKL